MFLSKLFDKGARSPDTKKSGNMPAIPERSSDTRWRAVEIQPGLMCCESARKISNEIYLASEAPSFPLDNCSQKVCRCKYKFLGDRRSGEDRRDESITLSSITQSNETDRRHLIGRRASDFEEWFGRYYCVCQAGAAVVGSGTVIRVDRCFVIRDTVIKNDLNTINGAKS